MESKTSRSALLIIGFIAASIFFGSGFLAGKKFSQNPSSKTLRFAKIEEVYEELRKEFFFKDSLDWETLEYGAAKGFVEALGDPYTYFLNPEEHKAFQEVINGSFEGIGAEIGLNEKREIIVIAPLEGTPAKRAGLQPQDVIIEVNGEPTAGLTLDAVVNLIRGVKGTHVILAIKRPSFNELITVSIIRDVIKIPVLEWEMQNEEIAYIQLFNFYERSGEVFSQTAREILGSNARKIILDLRGNPGGILQEAVTVGGWFIEKGGTIATERSSTGVIQTFASEGPGTLKEFPLVVLIDQGSASASEILAGALRIHAHATLVGEKTFGKGTVQIVKEFSDSSALRLTTSQWLLPNGTSIDEEGLTPDIQIPREGVNEGDDAQLSRAIELLQL